MVFTRVKWFYYILLYVMLYAYHFSVSKYPGDDFFYAKASKSNHIVPWLINRYHTWSGRIFPDAMEFTFLRNWVWLWHLINPLFILLLAYGIVRIWKREVGLLELLASLAILGYLKDNVLSSGFFWITGSMNYLWPITLGVWAMIPYADLVFRKDRVENNLLLILTLIFGFLASIGNEQAALCMSCFAVLAHLELIRQKRGQDKRLVLITFAIIAGTCILLFAPGNQVRWVKEVAYWYPGFGQLTIKDHFYLGTIWGFGKLFVDMRNLVLLLSIFAIILALKDKNTRSNKIFQLFTILFAIILWFHINGLGLGQLYGFNEIKNFRFTSTLFSLAFLQKNFIISIFPYSFWTIYSFMLVYLLVKSSKQRLFVLVNFLAAAATLMVMFFSPTIYASGNRVLAVGSTLLAIVLVGKIVENKLINSIFLICILSCFPIINLLQMLYKWHTAGFNPFL